MAVSGVRPTLDDERRTDEGHSAEFEGIAASGTRVRRPGIDILRIVDGLVAERWGVFDQLGMLRQLGAVVRSR
jgi:predicted ester cyclase